MKLKSAVFVFLAAALTSATAYAHHSFAGTYIEGQLVRLEGDIVQFNIRNPHSFILIEVKEKDGTKTKWGGEWGGVTQLSQGGVDRYTLEIGDYLIIDGAPSRDSSEKKVLVRRAERKQDSADKRPAFLWEGRVQ